MIVDWLLRGVFLLVISLCILFGLCGWYLGGRMKRSSGRQANATPTLPQVTVTKTSQHSVASLTVNQCCADKLAPVDTANKARDEEELFEKDPAGRIVVRLARREELNPPESTIGMCAGNSAATEVLSEASNDGQEGVGGGFAGKRTHRGKRGGKKRNKTAKKVRAEIEMSDSAADRLK